MSDASRPADDGAPGAGKSSGSRASTMLRNVSSNWSVNIVQILVFMVITPFVLNTLGKSVFGVWETIVGLSGPLFLMILGVPMASVRYLAEHVAKGDIEKANEAFSTCIVIAALMGLTATLVGVGLYGVFASEYLADEKWSSLGPETLADARLAFVVAVFTVTAGFVMRLPIAVFNANHDFVVRNIIIAGGLLLKLGLTIGLLSIDASLTVLAAVQFMVMAATFTATVLVVRHRYPLIRVSFSRFDRRLVRQILSFSIFAMLLNMGAMLAFRLDAVVIGLFRESEAVAVYGIGNKVFEPFINIVLAISLVVMPLATAMHRTDERSELATIFLKWSKISTSLVLLLGTYLLILGPEFLDWWIGDEYVPECGRLLQVLMVSFFLFLPMRGVALPILMGIDRPAGPAVGILVMGMANVTLSVLLIRHFGLLGVALGTAIPNVLFATYVEVIACRVLGVGMGTFFSYVTGRAVLGIVLPAGLLLALKLGLHVEGFLPLFLSGLGYVFVFGVIWVFFVFRGDPHLDLYARFIARRAS